MWRGGYQISYDAWFTQMISLELAHPRRMSRRNQSISPRQRAVATATGLRVCRPSPAPASSAGRRRPFLMTVTFAAPTRNAGRSASSANCQERSLLDTSYVGSVSHKLTTRADFNPQQLNGLRLHPALGQRWLRTSQGNSAYHALQSRVERRFARGLQLRRPIPGRAFSTAPAKEQTP